MIGFTVKNVSIDDVIITDETIKELGIEPYFFEGRECYFKEGWAIEKFGPNDYRPYGVNWDLHPNISFNIGGFTISHTTTLSDLQAWFPHSYESRISIGEGEHGSIDYRITERIEIFSEDGKGYTTLEFFDEQLEEQRIVYAENVIDQDNS
ncbi:MAG TPA: hypothetical protein DCR93_32880 [Cytophagales bacterium]|nr:hypothetical protein [Cytophagales bacterium]HAP64080.1 hypothetical protein [Cytophagales bacterium]